MSGEFGPSEKDLVAAGVKPEQLVVDKNIPENPPTARREEEDLQELTGMKGKVLDILQKLPNRVIAFHGMPSENLDSVGNEGLTIDSSCYFVVDPRESQAENLSQLVKQFHRSVDYATKRANKAPSVHDWQHRNWETFLRENKNKLPALAVFLSTEEEKSLPEEGNQYRNFGGDTADYLRYGQVDTEGSLTRPDYDFVGAVTLTEEDAERLKELTFTPAREKWIASKALSSGRNPEQEVAKFHQNPLLFHIDTRER